MDLNDAVRRAVRELRDEMQQTQAEFAKTLNVSYPTVQRYEQVVPPKGKRLLELKEIALEHNREDLARVFHDALVSGVGIGTLAGGGWDTSQREHVYARAAAQLADLKLLAFPGLAEALSSFSKALFDAHSSAAKELRGAGSIWNTLAEEFADINATLKEETKATEQALRQRK